MPHEIRLQQQRRARLLLVHLTRSTTRLSPFFAKAVSFSFTAFRMCFDEYTSFLDFLSCFVTRGLCSYSILVRQNAAKNKGERV